MSKASVYRSAPDSSERVLGRPQGRAKPDRAPALLDNTMRITTPENIAFQYYLCGPFRRVVAYLLDVMFSMAIYTGLAVLVSLLLLAAAQVMLLVFGNASIIDSLSGVLSGLFSIGFFLVYWFYGAYLETYYNGQTIGKRLMSMRVISTDGHAIDGVQATLRNFFRLLDLMPLVPLSAFLSSDSGGIVLPTGIFGLVVMTLSKRYQRLGDLVAATVVITEERNRRPNLAKFLDPRVPQLAELIPQGYVVSAGLAKAVADYIDQRKYLPPQRANAIAAHVAEPLLQQFGLPGDTNADLFVCSLYFRTFESKVAEEQRQDLTADWYGKQREENSTAPSVVAIESAGEPAKPLPTFARPRERSTE